MAQSLMIYNTDICESDHEKVRRGFSAYGKAVNTGLYYKEQRKRYTKAQEIGKFVFREQQWIDSCFFTHMIEFL